MGDQAPAPETDIKGMLSKVSNYKSFADICLDPSNRPVLSDTIFHRLMQEAKRLEAADPKASLEIMYVLAMKVELFPLTWLEFRKEILNYTIALVEQVEGRDYYFALKLAEIWSRENNHLAAAYCYRRAANAIGSNGITFLKMEYQGTDEATERIRFLREASVCFQLGGEGQMASDCYVESMKLSMKRSRRLESAKMMLGWIVWGWGEKPLHVILSAIFVILLYAILYSQFGIEPRSCLMWKRAIDSIYFSTITFSTVGYGDIHPASPFCKLLSASEGLMGIFFTGMFLVAFVKRYSR